MWRFALIIAAVSAFATTTQAQRAQLDDVDVGTAATCPSNEVLDQIVGFGAGGGSGGRGHTFVSAKNARVFRGAPVASPTIAVQPDLFRKVVIYGQTVSGARRYLVSWEIANQRRCGWMQADDLVIRRDEKGRLPALTALLQGPVPLLVSDIPDYDQKDNALVLKAVGANMNIVGMEGIKTYETPESGIVYQTFGLFEVFTVYDRKKGLRPRDRKDDHYYLIGRQARGEDQMYGWVHADDVYLWNSRLAASWAGTRKGRGWLDPSMTGLPFMTETADYVEPADAAIPRFPVIDQDPPAKEVQEKAKNAAMSAATPELEFARLVDRYLLVVPGRACPKNSTDETKCMSAEDAMRTRQKLAALITSLRRIEVLFLIDGTTSMDEYFPSTVEAIQKFSAKAFGTKDRPADLSIRVAASIYGDYVGGQTSGGIFYKPQVVEFHDPASGASRNLQALASYRPAMESDPLHKDKLEAPFAALIEAAKKTPWATNAGIRVIVHIADHGNREAGKTSGESQSSMVETVKIGDVIEALNQNNILYVPINVVGRPNESEQREIQAREAFLRQGADIKAKTLAGTGDVTRAYTNSRMQETPAQRVGAVVAALERSSEVFARGMTQADLRERCARQPGGPSCAELTQIEKSGASDSPTQIARRLLDVQGLTQQQIENIESRSQTVSYIWVRPLEKEGARSFATLNFYVALNEAGRDIISRATTHICNTLKPSNATANIDLDAGLAQATGAVANQKVSKNDLIAVRLSLPVTERNPALNIELSAVERAVQNKSEAFLKQLRGSYCKSAYLLLALSGNRRFSPDKVQVNPETGVGSSAESPKPYQWQVKVDRGEAFYYVPINYLPQ